MEIFAASESKKFALSIKSESCNALGEVIRKFAWNSFGLELRLYICLGTFKSIPTLGSK